MAAPTRRRAVLAVLACAALLAAFKWGDKYPSHPVLLNARNQLQGAQRSLEHATHDCGGHRAEALRDVQQALEALDKALSYADAHPDEDPARK